MSACGGTSAQEITVNSVTACLKDAGATATSTQPTPEPYGGQSIAARFPGPETVGIFVLNDVRAAKATGAAYALQHTEQSAYVSDDRKNVIVAPKDADSSLLSTLRSCAKP
jgi:hypothetical protein